MREIQLVDFIYPLKTNQMSKYYLVILSFFSFTIAFSQSQLELNQQEEKNYQKADKALNDVYQAILKEYKEDTAFTKNLKTAQRIWIQFRDAELKAKYPDRPEAYYGSVQPMCWSIYKTALTEERTKALRVWLTGIEEGDVCAGSVKTKQ